MNCEDKISPCEGRGNVGGYIASPYTGKSNLSCFHSSVYFKDYSRVR